MSITDRKSEHLALAARQESQGTVATGFDDVRLAPDALPDLDLSDVCLDTDWLGARLAAPLFVTGMTGGTPEAGQVNRGIAAACQALGLGMGLGSQRAMIEDPGCTDTFQVRDVAPDICLAANIGAAQLRELDTERILIAAEAVGATLLAVHLNAAQEVLQPGGDTNFRGIADRIRALVADAPLPVYIKEVGCGLTWETAKRFHDLGVAGIDVAGAGGTSWPTIESQRNAVTTTVDQHGLPTAWSLLEARKGFPGPLMASGGIRTSRHIVTALALGATACGMAWPVLRAFQRGSTEAVVSYLSALIEDLRRQFFVHGAHNVTDMQSVEAVLLGDTYAWARQRKLVAC